jgi:hypothetical protein
MERMADSGNYESMVVIIWFGSMMGSILNIIILISVVWRR